MSKKESTPKASKASKPEKGYALEHVDGIGEIKIADDVVATIVGLATTEVDGVYSISGNVTNELAGKLGIKNLSKGVKIEMLDGKAHAEISIVMKYCYSIPKTCSKIQEKVKNSVENMTGLKIDALNIKIEGVNTEQV
jgi:uncharacterized alkaline shock family protein YloU